MATNKQEPYILQRMPFRAYVQFTFFVTLALGIVQGVWELLTSPFGGHSFNFFSNYTVHGIAAGFVMFILCVTLLPCMGGVVGALTYYPCCIALRFVRGLKINKSCIEQLKDFNPGTQQEVVLLMKFPLIALMKLSFCVGFSSALIFLAGYLVAIPFILIITREFPPMGEMLGLIFLPLLPFYFGFIFAVSSIIVFIPYNLMSRFFGGLIIPVECFEYHPGLTGMDVSFASESSEEISDSSLPPLDKMVLDMMKSIIDDKT